MKRPPLSVVFDRRARLEVEAIDAWWRINRSVAPDLFLTELSLVLDALSLLPELGVQAISSKIAGARRILLRRSRHYLYYVQLADSLHVLSVWHSSRGNISDI